MVYGAVLNAFIYAVYYVTAQPGLGHRRHYVGVVSCDKSGDIDTAVENRIATHMQRPAPKGAAVWLRPTTNASKPHILYVTADKGKAYAAELYFTLRKMEPPFDLLTRGGPFCRVVLPWGEITPLLDVAVVENELSKLEEHYIIIRDNDPKGYNTYKGRAAEAKIRATVKALPKRSPGLQPLDYTFHSHIKYKLVQQSRDWPSDKVETVPEYKARVLACYNSLSKSAVDSGCGDMVRRLKQLYDAGGTNIKHE
jgi:hypothetical protein